MKLNIFYLISCSIFTAQMLALTPKEEQMTNLNNCPTFESPGTGDDDLCRKFGGTPGEACIPCNATSQRTQGKCVIDNNKLVCRAIS